MEDKIILTGKAFEIWEYICGNINRSTSLLISLLSHKIDCRPSEAKEAIAKYLLNDMQWFIDTFNNNNMEELLKDKAREVFEYIVHNYSTDCLTQIAMIKSNTGCTNEIARATINKYALSSSYKELEEYLINTFNK